MQKNINAKKKKATSKKRSILRSYPYTILITIAALLLSLFIIVHQAQKTQEQRSRAETANCTVSAADLQIDAEEQKMLTLLNEFRKQKGAPEVKLSTNITRSASWMSRDMATTNNLDHTDSLNRTPSKRAKDCGAPYGAENIAMGNTDAQGTMEQWIDSPGHNRNMGDPKYTVVGIARSGNYWTQVFAEEDEQVSPDPEQTTPTTPTTNVPNPECLGACVTESPSNTEPPEETTPSVAPDEIGEDIETPEAETTPALGTDTNGGDNFGGENAAGAGGIIALLLAFLKAILEAFLSIFN